MLEHFICRMLWAKSYIYFTSDILDLHFIMIQSIISDWYLLLLYSPVILPSCGPTSNGGCITRSKKKKKKKSLCASGIFYNFCIWL